MNSKMALLALISGTIIPFVTALLTKSSASSGVKGVVSAILSAAVAAIAYWTDFQGVATWEQTVIVGITAFITQAGMHFGLYRPTGTDAAVNKATGDIGIG